MHDEDNDGGQEGKSIEPMIAHFTAALCAGWLQGPCGAERVGSASSPLLLRSSFFLSSHHHHSHHALQEAPQTRLACRAAYR